MSLANVSRERTRWVMAAPIGGHLRGWVMVSCPVWVANNSFCTRLLLCRGLSVAWLQPNLKAMIYSVLCEYFHKTTCDDLNYR